MKQSIVTGMGEALWDMLPEGKKIGGAPANFAYHISQFGIDSRVVSADHKAPRRGQDPSLQKKITGRPPENGLPVSVISRSLPKTAGCVPLWGGR